MMLLVEAVMKVVESLKYYAFLINIASAVVKHYLQCWQSTKQQLGQ